MTLLAITYNVLAFLALLICATLPIWPGTPRGYTDEDAP